MAKKKAEAKNTEEANERQIVDTQENVRENTDENSTATTGKTYGVSDNDNTVLETRTDGAPTEEPRREGLEGQVEKK